MFTSKQITGYFKASNRQSVVGGGTTANDHYNIATFGITNAEYQAMHRRVKDAFGMIPPTASQLRRSLRGEYVMR